MAGLANFSSSALASSPSPSSSLAADSAASALQQQLLDVLAKASEQFQRIPGSAIFLRYIQSSHQNDPVRTAVELLLVLFAIRYLLSRQYSTKKQGGGNYVKLSEEEIDDLVEEWQPEPLVGRTTAFEENDLDKRAVIVGPTGPRVKLSNGRTVTNLASYNYYNFANNEALKERAIQTLRTYGVGPCGPPGFYGTQDVHMRVEADIAAFLGTTACIIYAQAFSTISGVIPAFSKRGDIIVADKGVNYAIRKGIQISRSHVLWYEHNNMDDLARVLAKVVKDSAKKPLTRRFIITEALFENSGEILDLPAVIELKSKYKFRLILDETWSFGVLGRTGRGLTEHQHVDSAEVDMIIGSMAGPLAAAGGFCAGSDDVVEHQRITAASYTYSAALPAMAAVTASETLMMLQTQPDLITNLREAVKVMWGQLDPRSDWVICTSAPENPIMLVVLKQEVISTRRLSVVDQQHLLQDIVDECLAQGILITRVKSLSPDAAGSKVTVYSPQPALKICLTIGLSKKEIEKAGTTIRHAITKIMTRKR